MLSLYGYQTAVAYSGAQGLQSAKDFAPDVILLDLGMPGMDGYEVCRRIRAQAWGAEVLVIAQTGWGQQHDRERTRQAGFDHHIVKPMDLAELLAMLRRA